MRRGHKSMAGKVIVVTGGARGIGAATAKALVAHGATVAIGDLDLVLAKQTADEIEATAYPLDVSDRDAFTAFLDQVEREHGPIDVLINNAGIMPLGRLEQESDASTARQLVINLHAVIHGTKEAVRRMKPRGRGHIVNVASSAGKIPVPGAATYAATKWGVVGYSESARLELRGSGIEITCVMPGIVSTELAAGLTKLPGVRNVTAADVAQSIVDALVRPRFEVYVPRTIGSLPRLASLLPRAVADRVARMMGGEHLMLDALDSGARRDYEARAQASAPAADKSG